MTRKTMYLDSMGFGLVAVKPIDYDPRDNMLTCRVTSRTSAGHYGQGYRTGQTVHLPPPPPRLQNRPSTRIYRSRVRLVHPARTKGKCRRRLA
jgi:hypothetical protein